MRWILTACCAFALASLAVAPEASALLIDDLSTPQTLVANAVARETWSQVPSLGSLGGERDVYLLLTSGSSINLDIAVGVMAHVEDAASDGEFYVVWDGLDAAPTINRLGLGGVELTEGGTRDAFSVEILFSATDATNLGFLAYSSLEDYSIVYFDAPAGASTQIIPFSHFVPLGGVGADFSNIGALAFFSLGAIAAQDMEFGRVETLPEPAGALAFAVGATAIALARARRLRRDSLCDSRMSSQICRWYSISDSFSPSSPS